MMLILVLLLSVSVNVNIVSYRRQNIGCFNSITTLPKQTTSPLDREQSAMISSISTFHTRNRMADHSILLRLLRYLQAIGVVFGLEGLRKSGRFHGPKANNEIQRNLGLEFYGAKEI